MVDSVSKDLPIIIDSTTQWVRFTREIAEKLRQNVTVDWSVRESVRARWRLLVKNLLRKYKYPPDQ